jgi:hypothetical protein
MARQPSLWGSDDRYYAGSDSKPDRREQQRLFDTSRRLADLLKAHDPELRARVERTFKQWNLILRDYLRTEMALRLTVGDDAQAIPVNVADGLPKPFALLMEEYIDMAWLLLNRAVIDDTVKGLQLVTEKYRKISIWVPFQQPPATAEEIQHACDYVNRLVGLMGELELHQRIGKIDQDILGAYFFRTPRIEIYWMVIGLIAATLNVSVEALTIVVLTHELAHAYSHLGRDIDGHRWDTDAFAATEIPVVEGLAQFYSGVVCQKLQSRMPASQTAFERLLALQPEPYRVQSGWTDKKDPAGELVRVTMIQVRSRGLTEYAEFQETLQAQRGNLKGTPATPQAKGA